MDVRGFPVAGITHELQVTPDDLVLAVEALTTCGHGHVFIVDQSRRGSTGSVRLLLSMFGVACVAKVLTRAPG